MKVVFVQPYYFNIWEALGVGYLGAHVRRHFRGRIELDFFQANFDSDTAIVDGAADADVVGFTCTSPSFAHARSLARALKRANPRVRTVFGGFHPSAVPEDCLAEEAVDQVVVGEGEEAFLRILDGERARLVTGTPLNDLASIVPDRALIKNERTVDLCERMVGRRITSFQSCRVCPFRCTFCAERAVTGLFHRVDNPVRVRPAGHLLDEIEQVARAYRLDHFKFVDATWNTSAEANGKVVEFCEEKLRLGWEANVHASLITRDVLALMKRADCKMISVGCESGSQRILADMKKGLRLDRVRDTFRWARELGIERRAYFLLGMPDETIADLRLTEQLVEEIDPDVFGITILCPYPGTDHYDREAMRGWDWSCTDEYANPYWSTRHFTNGELKAWQAHFTRRFESRLAWHHRALEGGAGNE